MMKRVLVGAVALAILVGVAFLLAEILRSSAFRTAEAERNLCYAQRGYDLMTAPAIPPEIRDECTRPLAEYSAGETMRYVYGGLAGLLAAGLFLLLAWLFMFRRKPDGTAPGA